MVRQDAPALHDYLADDIRDHADELVEEWMEWITEDISLRPARMLPREAIRDHIPGVMRSIAESLRGPPEAVNAALGTLKTHARLRHDQGYDIEELLKEYHGLARIAGDQMLSTLERYPGKADPLEVARVFLRLSQGLSAISDLTVGAYRNTEVQQQRELHRQLEDYVRTITHELKQPLHAITAGAGMLEEDGVAGREEQRKRYLQMIRDGITRSASLLDDIRTLVLFEGAQQHEEWQPLESAIHLVLREMREHARKRNVRIDVAHPLPRINVHATRVEIALVNLISNAIKYSDPDKPERWVRIDAERREPQEASRWEIRVTDNGLGIPRNVQGQIFERHFRAHPDVGEGTGLGLAISRRVIEQGGGKIWFESEVGIGSTFHFVLPASLEEGAPDAEEPNSPLAEAQPEST